MEENALICNIAAILSKDFIIDEINNQPKNDLNAGKESTTRYHLLEDDSVDEAILFFMDHQKNSIHEMKEEICKDDKSENKVIVEASLPRDLKDGKRKMPLLRGNDLNLINYFENREFEDFLHMNKITFTRIFRAMRDTLLQAKFSPKMTAQTVFSIALWKLTTDEHFEEISRKFHITFDDCNSAIRQFWILVSRNYENYIKWPNTVAVQKQVLKCFRQHEQLRKFHNLYGLAAIKCLDIFLENEDEYVSVVVQIICNAAGKVLDCFVEYTHEYAFDASPIGMTLALNRQTIPKGSYLLGSMHFPLKPYLLREFLAPVSQEEKSFNAMLQPAISLANGTLESMAKRFNTLYALEARDLSEMRKIMETVCSLHNLCIDSGDNYVERKREMTGLSWAANGNEATISGDDSNKEGVKRRTELLKQLINTKEFSVNY